MNAALMLFGFKGMLIGFAIAAPVGPIGLLCIQRTLIRGRLVRGCSPGWARPAPMRYTAGIAGFGLASLADRCYWRGRPNCASSAGCFCSIWAWRTWRAEPAAEQAQVESHSRWVAGRLSFYIGADFD
jgi:putative LysE/RhtB family amino acid efflux pump